MQIVSYLSPNLLWLYEAVGAYLGRSLGVTVQIAQAANDPLDDPALAQDQWDVLFICGLPLMRLEQNAPGRLTPLVAPVMQAERYGDKPLYFSDVVVRADSPLTGWNDLAQTVFCYNDKGSHSGYNVVRHQLLGQKPGFFSRVVQSGSHVRSLQWILEGKADCAAIDSTVLEQALRSQPDWATQLRVITSLGPFPMPPLVASRRLGEGRHRVIQQALLQPDSALQHALAQAGMRRFAPVDLALYRPVLQLHTAALAANRKFV